MGEGKTKYMKYLIQHISSVYQPMTYWYNSSISLSTLIWTYAKAKCGNISTYTILFSCYVFQGNSFLLSSFYTSLVSLAQPTDSAITSNRWRRVLLFVWIVIWYTSATIFPVWIQFSLMLAHLQIIQNGKPVKWKYFYKNCFIKISKRRVMIINALNKIISAK